MPCDVAASMGMWLHLHGEERGATAMTDTPTDDRPGFVAEEPVHCHACYRLMLWYELAPA